MLQVTRKEKGMATGYKAIFEELQRRLQVTRKEKGMATIFETNLSQQHTRCR